jgi:hypothetical protein
VSSTEEIVMQSWESPSFIEVDMSAEIGGYQGDDVPDRNPDPVPDFVEQASEV